MSSGPIESTQGEASPSEPKKPRWSSLFLTFLAACLIGICCLGMIVPNNHPRASQETYNRIDITQLDAALTQKFFSRFGFYPPSSCMLCENEAGYPDNELANHSRAVLHRLFPRLPMPWVGIDWNGNGIIDAAPVTLTGDQCLVFFLGGIPSPVAMGAPMCLGFSTNPLDPAAPGGVRILFFDFKSRRLYCRFANSGFYSYRDAYGQQPFAFFSAYNKPNGYNPRLRGKSGYPETDCPGLGFVGRELFPYAAASEHYLNPNTFQIISAGPDGHFGLGSNPTLTPIPYWTAATASNMYPMLAVEERSAYQDDQANFAAGPLQVGP